MNLKASKLASLFLVIFEEGSVEVWDIEKFKKARFFQLDSSVNDAFFSADNKFVFVATRNKSLSIFDILSGKMISKIHLQASIQSMDISPDGELIATNFEGERDI